MIPIAIGAGFHHSNLLGNTLDGDFLFSVKVSFRYSQFSGDFPHFFPCRNFSSRLL